MFWKWDRDEQRLGSFSLAWVLSMEGWVVECRVLDEIDIPEDLMALPAGRPPAGTGNDDDDLPGLVGKWDVEESRSEDEVTDDAREDGSDGETGPAVGDDAN